MHIYITKRTRGRSKSKTLKIYSAKFLFYSAICQNGNNLALKHSLRECRERLFSIVMVRESRTLQLILLAFRKKKNEKTIRTTMALMRISGMLTLLM